MQLLRGLPNAPPPAPYSLPNSSVAPAELPISMQLFMVHLDAPPPSEAAELKSTVQLFSMALYAPPPSPAKSPNSLTPKALFALRMQLFNVPPYAPPPLSMTMKPRAF